MLIRDWDATTESPLTEALRSSIASLLVAQLREGRIHVERKYDMPSFYMPDDRTLLVMPDVTLRKMLAPVDLNATSPLLQRVSNLQGGDDLYVMVDVASLRPLIVPWMNVAVAQRRRSRRPQRSLSS